MSKIKQKKYRKLINIIKNKDTSATYFYIIKHKMVNTNYKYVISQLYKKRNCIILIMEYSSQIYNDQEWIINFINNNFLKKYDQSIITHVLLISIYKHNYLLSFTLLDLLKEHESYDDFNKAMIRAIINNGDRNDNKIFYLLKLFPYLKMDQQTANICFNCFNITSNVFILLLHYLKPVYSPAEYTDILNKYQYNNILLKQFMEYGIKNYYNIKNATIICYLNHSIMNFNIIDEFKDFLEKIEF